MAKYFIKSISIEGFRGINNDGSPLLIEFQTDGVTSFFGENGKGKSSIFEAFLYSIFGRIIRFDSYHADIKDKKTIKNIFHTNDGAIVIEFIDSLGNITDINVKINANGERIVSSISNPNPEQFLSLLCSELNFLDYKSFEKILLTSSEETGKLFSNLVGFGNFIKIKENIDKISRTQNINNDFGKTAKENSIRGNNQKISELKEQTLIKLLEINTTVNPYDKKEILKHLNAFLKKQYSFVLKEIKNTSQVDFDELIKLKIGSNYEESISKLNLLEGTYTEIKLLQESLNKFNKRTIDSLGKKFRNAYLQIENEDAIVLGRLYEDAIKSYDTLNRFDKNTCVLCNTDELGNGRDSFYQQINHKIKSYVRFKNSYAVFKNEFLGKISDCKLIEIEKKIASDENRFFSNIENTNEFLNRDFFEVQNLNDIITSYKLEISKRIKEIDNSIKSIKKNIPPKISELIETNNIYKFAFNSSIEIDLLANENNFNSKYLAELENWITFIEKVKNEYESSYNVLMDEIASLIDADTKLFFREIMGNIDVIPKLKKENRGQKVNILLEKFYSNTTDIKAASLLSESYRNALSLSIYFAAALKSKSQGNFIIVDDITSSFDSGHQLFLLDLIKRKISVGSNSRNGKQIILLTHDGLLRKILNENDSLSKWKHYNLNSHKDLVSIKPINSNELRDIIVEKINSNYYAGSDFRMYYEFILLEIIEKLNLEVPFSLINSNDNKMINKLSHAIYEIIELKRTSHKIRGIRFLSSIDFKQHTQLVGNNLSHWASGREVSLATPVLIKILDDIDDYKKLFQYECTCAKGLGWIYYKSLSSPKHKGCTCNI